MFTLRKVERRTLWEATEPVNFNPEAFKSLSENAYEGDVNDEEAFVNYIQGLYWEDWYEISEQLEANGFEEDANAIFGIFEGDLKCYSDTSEDGENSWMEIGEVDESYRKVGGFNSRYDTMS